MEDDCCGHGNCKEKEEGCCGEHEHNHGAFAVDQLAMTNNVLVNTLIDMLIQKGVFKEEEFEAKLKEQGVEGYSEEPTKEPTKEE